MPRAQDPSQSLLRWGIENAQPGTLRQTAEDIKAGKRPDLNPEILKAMMGQSDAEKMRECMLVIEGHWVDRDGTGEVKNSADITPEDRYRAWEDLEMLIQDLDNANDLQNMGLWDPIIKHLTSDDDETVMYACWVCGTAVQNNPKSQKAFLDHDPLPTISSIVSSSSASSETRAKALYALSSALKHWDAAVQRFSELGGWQTLTQTLQDPSLKMRAKTAFLLSQIVTQSPDPSSLLSSLRTASTLPTLIDSLSPSTAVPTGATGEQQAIDRDFRDKGLRFLVNTVERTKGTDGGLSREEKDKVQNVVAEAKQDGEWSHDDVGVAADEWAAFKEELKA
ncbi:Hsp70 nucleotide exchange factor FES1 [Rhodotorula paludigena]|uniref:Hsp70 nucleotide exchange factor FES1 n=1 Tax=Rhodotorula paludigena TaxID=86838 RepID=UPI003170792F